MIALAGSDNGIRWLRLFFVREPGRLIASSVTSPHCKWAISSRLAAVKVFYQPDKQQTLADFARTSNTRWIAANPTAKISELPIVERANGKPAFLRFAFENPRKAQQAYEVGALGVDSDKDGNDFVLDVVMTGNSKAALDRADAAYPAFLKAH